MLGYVGHLAKEAGLQVGYYTPFWGVSYYLRRERSRFAKKCAPLASSTTPNPVKPYTSSVDGLYPCIIITDL